MTTLPMLAGFFGGWELVLIATTLLILVWGAAAVAGITFLIIWASKKKASGHPAPAEPRRSL
jgi:hypothetical protein